MQARPFRSAAPAMEKVMDANNIFKDHGSANLLATAADKDSLPRSYDLPEIVVTGRANVGKSTLLNCVLGRKDLLYTSKRAGRTQTMNFYRVGQEPGKLIVVDSPGYGVRGRPEWGKLFNHYIVTRTQLRRVYILIAAHHGLIPADNAMLTYLDAQVQLHSGTRFTLQAVITQADTLGREGRETIERIHHDICKAAPACLPSIVTAFPRGKPMLGLDELRKSIAQVCSLVTIED